MERKKIVHVLDTPFSAASWPQISQADQDAILELLCRLLAPLGVHRTTHATKSQGRRRKRHRLEADAPVSTPAPPPPPPLPDLAAYVDVGLASISRGLQQLSSKQESVSPAKGDNVTNGHGEEPPAKEEPKPYCVVFVARAGQSAAFNCHIPQMVAVASNTQPSKPPIRLVGLSKPCEERLSAALGIPRVSSIALREDAPHAKGLIDFVRDHVAAVEAPWVDEAQSAKFKEMKIDAVPTKVGSAKNKRPRPS